MEHKLQCFVNFVLSAAASWGQLYTLTTVQCNMLLFLLVQGSNVLLDVSQSYKSFSLLFKTRVGAVLHKNASECMSVSNAEIYVGTSGTSVE